MLKSLVFLFSLSLTFLVSAQSTDWVRKKEALERSVSNLEAKVELAYQEWTTARDRRDQALENYERVNTASGQRLGIYQLERDWIQTQSSNLLRYEKQYEDVLKGLEAETIEELNEIFGGGFSTGLEDQIKKLSKKIKIETESALRKSLISVREVLRKEHSRRAEEVVQVTKVRLLRREKWLSALLESTATEEEILAAQEKFDATFDYPSEVKEFEELIAEKAQAFQEWQEATKQHIILVKALEDAEAKLEAHLRLP